MIFEKHIKDLENEEEEEREQEKRRKRRLERRNRDNFVVSTSFWLQFVALFLAHTDSLSY